MLLEINDIGTQQAEPTENTQTKIEILLNYVATYLHVNLIFHASGMVLQVDSDKSQWLLTKARSHITGYFRLDKNSKNTQQQHPNGVVLIECKILSNMASSAAEAEICGVFHNT